MGHYAVFDQWWWVEEESYLDLTVTNLSDHKALTQALTDYQSSGFLGTGLRPLAAEGIASSEARQTKPVRVYFLQPGQGQSPDYDSLVRMDVLGTSSNGTYYLDQVYTFWMPERIERGGQMIGLPTGRRTWRPSPPTNPVWSWIADVPATMAQVPAPFVKNPFTETVTVAITQSLPAGVVVMRPTVVLSVVEGFPASNAGPGAGVLLTYTVAYQGPAEIEVESPALK